MGGGLAGEAGRGAGLAGRGEGVVGGWAGRLAGGEVQDAGGAARAGRGGGAAGQARRPARHAHPPLRRAHATPLHTRRRLQNRPTRTLQAPPLATPHTPLRTSPAISLEVVGRRLAGHAAVAFGLVEEASHAGQALRGGLAGEAGGGAALAGGGEGVVGRWAGGLAGGEVEGEGGLAACAGGRGDCAGLAGRAAGHAGQGDQAAIPPRRALDDTPPLLKIAHRAHDTHRGTTTTPAGQPAPHTFIRIRVLPLRTSREALFVVLVEIGLAGLAEGGALAGQAGGLAGLAGG